MAETKNKQTYTFGAHTLDPKLYLKNLRSNALGYLESRTDWTPELKQEWQNSYNAYVKAFQEDADNGGGRFSTDDFGNIIDKKGEFSNIDNDLYYYNSNGKLINLDLYNLLKDRKKNAYKSFDSNMWFATYANQVGNALVKAMKAKQGTEDNGTDFDYAKNGFSAYWQKKYNPAGDTNDPSIYWKLDKDGQYTNRVNTTITDLDDYIANSNLPDNVKSAMLNYRDTLATYSTDSNFNVEDWKNRVSLAATKAGVSTWNNGYFNFGNNGSPADLSTSFDINNDEDLLNRYPELRDLIAAHPELRDILIANKRAEYNKESLAITDAYNKKIANENWNAWLAQNPKYADVRKRLFDAKHTFYTGYTFNGNNIISNQSRQAIADLGNALGRKADSDDWFYAKVSNPLSKAKVTNLGQALAYYLPYLEKTPEFNKVLFSKYLEKVKDAAGNTVYKVRNSKNKAGEHLYFIYNNGRLRWYRSKSYLDLRNGLPKAQWGFKVKTLAEKLAENNTNYLKELQKKLENPATPEELKRKIEGSQTPETGKQKTIVALRASSVIGDIASMLSAFGIGVGTVGSAAAGLSSTALNGIADSMDDSVSKWDTAKNVAMGLGLDAVGLIPGLGMSVKVGNIAKNVAKIAPTVMTALAAADALSAESLKSWKKLGSPSSLTMQDWRNIMNGLIVFAGGARAVKGHMQVNAIRLASKTGNFKITTKSGKEISLTPEQTRLLNNAKSVEEANGLLGKWFKGEEVQTKDSSWWLKMRHPINESKRAQKPVIKARTEYGDINYAKLRGISLRDIKWLKRMSDFGEAKLPDIRLFRNPYINYGYVEPKTFSHVPYASSKAMFPLVTTNKVYTIPNTPKSVLRDYASSKGIYLGDIATPTHNPLFESRRAMPFYKGSYKKGGIIKAQQGNKLWYSGFSKYDKANDVALLNTDKLYSGDMSDNTLRDPIVSNLNGLGVGRYKPAEGNTKEYTLKIEALPYYKSFENLILNQDGTFTDVGLKWAHAVDAYLPKGSKASFFKDDGTTLNTEWTVTNNDAYNRGPLTYKSLRDYVKQVRFDEINGARHNIFINLGKHYYYLDNLGLKVYVNPKEIDGYSVSDTPTESNFDADTGTLWDEYLVTAPASKTGIKEEPLLTANGNPLDLLKNAKGINPIDTYGVLRAMTADAFNAKIAKLAELQSYLQDPLENLRYVQSDLDAEANGQRAAAQYNLSVSRPLTSNGNLQTMALLDAAIKGLDAITLGKLQSNLYLRQMAELAILQGIANHASRHDTAMFNRQSLWQTDQANRNIKTSYLNLKFTVWDALAQEKEFEAKQDRELRKAMLDKFAESRINDRIKYLLRDYIGKYGLSKEDVDLWDNVYLNGTTSLQDILKDPAKYLQWSRILNATALIKSDLTANWYGIPTSDLASRWSPYNVQIQFKSGGCLNKKKIREAASGDKLAVALLKAATADADRFNKSVNAFIDRSYDAISRLMDYSTKKKKTKKKSK